MARTLSSALVFASVLETALGIAGTSGWRTHRPTGITKFAAGFTTMTNDAIGGNRMVQRGEVTDLNADISWASALSKDDLDNFGEGMFASQWKPNGNTGTAKFFPAAFTGSAATVTTGGALVGGALGTGATLIYVRGSRIPGNNGLKQVAAGSAAGSIPFLPAPTAEASPPVGTTIDVAGWIGATGDIGLDGSGNLTSTANIFASLGLVVGTWICIGGPDAATSFANPLYRGMAQVVSVAAGLITLRRRSWTVGAADPGATKTIHIYTGPWIRNTTSQDADYLERSYTFEITHATLGVGSTPLYHYAQGEALNRWTFAMQGANRIEATWEFVGASVVDPTAARLTGASAARPSKQTAMYNTAVGFRRIRMTNADETGLSTAIKQLSFTGSNNITGETILGTLGRGFINWGDFTLTGSGELVFTSVDVITAVRDKRKVMIEVGARNGDGGFMLDVPAAQIDTNDLTFADNMGVGIPVTFSATEDLDYGYMAGMTVWPYLPAS